MIPSKRNRPRAGLRCVGAIRAGPIVTKRVMVQFELIVSRWVGQRRILRFLVNCDGNAKFTQRGEIPHGRRWTPKRTTTVGCASESPVMPQPCPAVAQISNLLYRRIPFGRPPDHSKTQEFSEAGGLEVRDSAGWKPALRGFSPGKTEALRITSESPLTDALSVLRCTPSSAPTSLRAAYCP